MHKIIGSTDNQFIGVVLPNITTPILLGTIEFYPDKSPTLVSEGVWRFSNSNYSIDIKEV